jgi:hypothetical protein
MNEKCKPSYSLAPNIDYHRNRAKALLRDLQAGEHYALWEFCQFHPDGKLLTEEQASDRSFALHDAQMIVARTHGCANWVEFKTQLETRGSVPGDLKFIGFISTELPKTKEFYTSLFAYTLHIDEPDALIIRSPKGVRTLGFLRPNQNPKHSITSELFSGHGVYLTFGTDDVMRDFAAFKAKGIPIETGPIATAGEILFMVRDPNGIGIYISERRF